jgi:Anti-sigma factor NepR
MKLSNDPAAPHSGAQRRPEKAPKQGMSPDLQAHIGRHLRALFDEVAREPIPDRFLQLLKDLEKNGPKKNEPKT